MIDIDMLYQELERLHCLVAHKREGTSRSMRRNLSETLLRSFEYRDIEEEPNQPDIALVKHIVDSLEKLEKEVAGSTQYFYFN
jgi:hypothetical protein